MKPAAAFAKSLLMAVSLYGAVSLPAQVPAKPAKPAVPAKPAPAAPLAKIDGITLARKDGTYLGLTVDGNHRMVLKFYDAEKKPAAVSVARAFARWDPVNKRSDVRAVLNPEGDGFSLVSPSVVQPPLVFKVYLTLFAADGAVVETLIADMRELDAAAAGK